MIQNQAIILKSRYGEIKVLDSLDSLLSTLADQLVELVKTTLKEKNQFSAALAGGNTPKALYQLLASDAYRSKIDWNRMLIFLGDERCVPHTSSESNSHMIDQSLVSRINIPNNNVFFPENQDKDPDGSSKNYEKKLKDKLGVSPILDLVLLGLGTDGHTASLFPNTAALQETSHIYVSNFVAKLNSWRLTMTFSLISNAKNVIFLVTGESKAEILADIMHSSAKYPAQFVNPKSGNLTWYIDKTAGKLLNLDITHST